MIFFYFVLPLSNIRHSGSNVDLPNNANFPKNTLLHTMSIKKAGKVSFLYPFLSLAFFRGFQSLALFFQPLFVTIYFSTQDDLKKAHKVEDNVAMGGRKVVDIHPGGGSLWEVGTSSFSLWEAKLFPCCETRGESVDYAIAMAKAVAESKRLVATKPLHGYASMAEALVFKDPEEMLRYRTGLETDILVASLCRIGSKNDIASIPLVKELAHELVEAQPENLEEALLAKVALRCAEKGHQIAHSKIWNFVLERANQGLEATRKRRKATGEEGLRRLISFSQQQIGGGK